MILDIAIRNHVSSEEMPKSIIVISDMEIDCATTHNYYTSRNWLFYDTVEHMYAEHGYTIPNVIFWNVASRNDVFHADSDRKGVQLVSGSSPTAFKHVIEMIGMTPVEAMHKILDAERYMPVTIAK